MYNDVKSTAERIPSIEVNVDTVYIRTNIVKIDEEDFEGWQYDEVQYQKDRYIELISEENNDLKQRIEATDMALMQIMMEGVV